MKEKHTLYLIYTLFALLIAFPIGVLILQVLGYIPIQDSIYLSIGLTTI